MLGASPTSTWACPWTCTWAWAMLDYLYYKYPGVGNMKGYPVDQTARHPAASLFFVLSFPTSCILLVIGATYCNSCL